MHFGFPHPHDLEPTSLHVGILGYIQCHAFLLTTVGSIVLAGVSVPVVTIELNGNGVVGQHCVHDKFALESVLRFIPDARLSQRITPQSFKTVGAEILLQNLHSDQTGLVLGIFVSAWNGTVDGIGFLPRRGPVELLVAHLASVFILGFSGPFMLTLDRTKGTILSRMPLVNGCPH